MLLVIAVLMAALTLEPVVSQAQEATGSFLPVVPKATGGESCVREPEFMRKNHISLLQHKRDLTVYDGDRTEDLSLKGCIACHAVSGTDGTPVTVADPNHFCRACHDYAAVSVDCFQCHASRPEPLDNASRSTSGHAAYTQLSDYLKEVLQ